MQINFKIEGDIYKSFSKICKKKNWKISKILRLLIKKIISNELDIIDEKIITNNCECNIHHVALQNTIDEKGHKKICPICYFEEQNKLKNIHLESDGLNS